MAKTGRGTTARRNPNTVRHSREVYVQGNAVKRLQEVPHRTDLPDAGKERFRNLASAGLCDRKGRTGKKTGAAGCERFSA